MSNDLITAEVQRFELEQRKAKAFSLSAFFPKHLWGQGQNAAQISVANATIVYDIAYRMNLSPLEVAQSIFIIQGKPSFETKFLVARLNTSGLLKGRLNTIVSQDGQSAYCEAIDAQTGAVLRGTTITMEMAKREGWLGKNGSKWQTMPTLMLKYRAQSFFINEFFPEVRLGLRTKEEIQDIVDVEEVQKDTFKPEPTQNLNELLSSSEKPNSSVGAKNSQTEKAEYIEAAPVEVEIDVNADILPLDALQSEMMNRGASEVEAEKLLARVSPDEAKAYLADPNSIDALMENLRS
ncbi:recombinase family protein [Campylobacter concisus]